MYAWGSMMSPSSRKEKKTEERRMAHTVTNVPGNRSTGIRSVCALCTRPPPCNLKGHTMGTPSQQRSPLFYNVIK